MSEGWSALESVLYPVLTAGALFLIITVLVLVPKGARRRPGRSWAGDPIWFGGPGVGERADGESDLVLTGAPPSWAETRPVDWREAIERRPDGQGGRETGGASAGW